MSSKDVVVKAEFVHPGNEVQWFAPACIVGFRQPPWRIDALYRHVKRLLPHPAVDTLPVMKARFEDVRRNGASVAHDDPWTVVLIGRTVRHVERVLMGKGLGAGHRQGAAVREWLELIHGPPCSPTRSQVLEEWALADFEPALDAAAAFLADRYPDDRRIRRAVGDYRAMRFGVRRRTLTAPTVGGFAGVCW